MNARDIINKISRDKDYIQICKNIGRNQWEDLFQELIVILCETDPSKIEDIYNNQGPNKLRGYIIRILENQFKSNTSSFFKTHKSFTEKSIPLNPVYDCKDDTELSEEELEVLRGQEQKLSFLEKELDTNNPSLTLDDWYERTLVKAAIIGGTNNLAKSTKIYKKTIMYTVKKVKTNMLDKFEQNKPGRKKC
jgi:hypothetical protein